MKLHPKAEETLAKMQAARPNHNGVSDQEEREIVAAVYAKIFQPTPSPETNKKGT